ncbi:class I SAM-dependent methyltransferase [Streptomyces fragilis]|uniref:Class I SAM-dependent methyltransferase n=1 Tax=Streptomyces fragilis TaxID=67301 RepID=A0ABV2YP59_9ACTN|nr:class I SAM-dependent methyltransferase [Streptomyces fragilis]
MTETKWAPDSCATRPQDSRASHGTVAEDHAALLCGELSHKPFDRAMLAAFADRVRARGGGPVAELGCGPGRITAHLHRLGLDVLGVDPSPQMIRVARRDHPALRFEVGDTTALDLADASLAGVCARYSTAHTPPEGLPRLFAESHRVLAPGGTMLLAFEAGALRRNLTHAHGHDLSLEVDRARPEPVERLLARAGLTVEAQLVREPEERERGPQGYVLAHRPPPEVRPRR